jgi:para-aminobenzoate synthetase/4-amino-4-deoxychorismate lyase
VAYAADNALGEFPAELLPCWLWYDAVVEVFMFELLETMLLRDDDLVLRERHLARLQASAADVGFAFDLPAIEQALDMRIAELGAGLWRLRLLVAHDGSFTLAHTAIVPEDQPVEVAFAREPIQADLKFIRNKTTQRAHYDAFRAAYNDVFDVILWNKRGELTEFTYGNLVLEIDGERLTPALESGLLPGTMRAELLAAGEIREARLLREDVARATRLWFINSVRGWREVLLLEDAYSR